MPSLLTDTAKVSRVSTYASVADTLARRRCWADDALKWQRNNSWRKSLKKTIYLCHLDANPLVTLVDRGQNVLGKDPRLSRYTYKPQSNARVARIYAALLALVTPHSGFSV